jgi:hypothetical protein
MKYEKWNTINPLTQKSLKYLSLNDFFWTAIKYRLRTLPVSFESMQLSSYTNYYWYCPQNIPKFPTHCNKHVSPQRKLWSTEPTMFLNHQCLKVKQSK